MCIRDRSDDAPLRAQGRSSQLDGPPSGGEQGEPGDADRLYGGHGEQHRKADGIDGRRQHPDEQQVDGAHLDSRGGEDVQHLRPEHGQPGLPEPARVTPGAVRPGLLGADNPGGDASWFREAGLSMLGPEVLDVFAAPGVQMGPVYLLFIGVLTTAVDAVGLPVLFTVAAVQAIGIAWFALFTTRRWAVELGAAPLRAQWGVVAPVSYTHLTLPTILRV